MVGVVFGMKRCVYVTLSTEQVESQGVKMALGSWL